MVWVAFCVLVYMAAFADYAYYRHNFARKFSAFIDAITEDE